MPRLIVIDCSGIEQVLVLSAQNVALWWPNGHGPSTQALYNLTTTLTLSDGPPDLFSICLAVRLYVCVLHTSN